MMLFNAFTHLKQLRWANLYLLWKNIDNFFLECEFLSWRKCIVYILFHKLIKKKQIFD